MTTANRSKLYQLAVEEAYKHGKGIEIYSKHREDWELISTPHFLWDSSDYRIARAADEEWQRRAAVENAYREGRPIEFCRLSALAAEKAYREGKPLESCRLSHPVWKDCDVPLFWWATNDYRIKEVPEKEESCGLTGCQPRFNGGLWFEEPEEGDVPRVTNWGKYADFLKEQYPEPTTVDLWISLYQHNGEIYADGYPSEEEAYEERTFAHLGDGPHKVTIKVPR